MAARRGATTETVRVHAAATGAMGPAASRPAPAPGASRAAAAATVPPGTSCGARAAGRPGRPRRRQRSLRRTPAARAAQARFPTSPPLQSHGNSHHRCRAQQLAQQVHGTSPISLRAWKNTASASRNKRTLSGCRRDAPRCLPARVMPRPRRCRHCCFHACRMCTSG